MELHYLWGAQNGLLVDHGFLGASGQPALRALRHGVPRV